MSLSPALRRATERLAGDARVIGFAIAHWRDRPALLTLGWLTTLGSLALDVSLPWACGKLIDATASRQTSAHSVWQAWCVLVALQLLFVFTRNGSKRFWLSINATAMQKITEAAVSKALSFSHQWHADRMSGATTRTVIRAGWGYDAISDALAAWVGPSVLALGGFSLMLGLKQPAAGAIAIIATVLFVVVNATAMSGWATPSDRRTNELDANLSGAISDTISAHEVVRSFAGEAWEKKRIHSLAMQWRSSLKDTWNRFMTIALAHNLLLAGLQAGITAVMVQAWLAGDASSGDLTFAITTCLIMAGYMRNLDLRMLQRGIAEAYDVATWMRTPPQIDDAPDASDLNAARGRVSFENVTFGYPSSGRKLYQGLNVSIEPGEYVALVGPTGSGKSTFGRLLQRLYDVDEGRILIDGQDISRIRQSSLRRAIAFVPQEPALFHRTLRENIAYANPEASEDEIVKAAQHARAHEFIMRLPDGYDTVVGDRGLRLSGGERQRIAIARAFLCDAPIILFDEATSALDPETEAEVQTAMNSLVRGRTTIVIAHRFSTIRNASRILVFRDGCLVEEGDHAELTAADGHYARLSRVAV